MSRSGQFLEKKKELKILRIETEDHLLFLVSPTQSQEIALGEALLGKNPISLDLSKLVDLTWIKDGEEWLRASMSLPFFTHAPHASNDGVSDDTGTESAN